MKAAILQSGRIHVGDMAEPVPGPGQALVRTHRCGLCASDAHFLSAGQTVVDMSIKHGGPYAGLDLERPIVMGHEYVGEIVDYGPGSERPLRIGTRVTSQPIVRSGGRHAIVGQSHDCPGGFGELMLLDETFMLAVPDGLPDELAALTEPLAVGLEHARSGEPQKGDVALVVGCGAIGLGVIAGLKLMGIAPIIGADLDPGRRALALRMGADIVVDPREESPYGLAAAKPTIIFECVGKPGMLAQMMNSVGFGAKIVVGGFCLEPEQIYVPSGQMRRLKLFFAAGEEKQDMELALRSIADGRIDVTPWLGEDIGLGGVADALTAMNSPAAPVRTLVDPRVM